MTPRERLAAIEARCEAATAAPWEATMHSPDMSGRHGYTVRGPRSLGPQGMVMEARMLTSADADFVTHSRDDVPALVAFARAVLDAADGARIETSDGLARLSLRDTLGVLAETHLGGAS